LVLASGVFSNVLNVVSVPSHYIERCLIASSILSRFAAKNPRYMNPARKQGSGPPNNPKQPQTCKSICIHIDCFSSFVKMVPIKPPMSLPCVLDHWSLDPQFWRQSTLCHTLPKFIMSLGVRKDCLRFPKWNKESSLDFDSYFCLAIPFNMTSNSLFSLQPVILRRRHYQKVYSLLRDFDDWFFWQI
jgi:hypothetical protein